MLRGAKIRGDSVKMAMPCSLGEQFNLYCGED